MSVQELQNLVSEKFTEEVLCDMIKKSNGLISDVKVTKIIMGDDTKKGDAYLSCIARFIVEGTGKNAQGKKKWVSVPVVVKCLPKNIARRKTFRSTDFFENEIIFYEKVWTLFQEFQNSNNVKNKFDNIPRVLSAYVDGSNDYIAMLDLAHEGYEDATRGTGLDYENTVAILKTLAGFHALSLAVKDQQPQAFEKVATCIKENYFVEKYRTWYQGFRANIDAIARDAIKQELPPMYLKKIEELITNDIIGMMCDVCAKRGPLAVVNHGDVWAPNFLPKYDASGSIEKIMMIDFQICRYATLATDLLFFLYSCVDPNVMEERWDHLLSVYHKALSDSLQNYGSKRDLVTLEALHNELKVNNAFGIAVAMEVIIMSLLDDDEVSDLDVFDGEEAVPLESVWIIPPLKEKYKKRRIAQMVKFAIDKYSL